MRVLLDTNILLDVLLDREGLADESEETILACIRSGCESFVAWHGLATVYYLATKKLGREQALEKLDLVLTWAKVADVTDADARRARALEFRDFEDALQAVSAQACGVETLVTRNVKDFGASPVRAETPSSFLKRFSGT